MLDYSVLALPKPEPRRKTKARKVRREAGVLQAMRADVFARDIGCRAQFADVGRCLGRLTLAHLRRKSASRGMAPELRHRVDEAIVLCIRHHSLEETHQLRWAYLDDEAKANGPLHWDLA